MSFNSEKLWESFRNGDIKAMESIYRHFYQSLYNYGFKVCNNSDLIRDAIHNLFMDLWRRHEHLGPTQNLRFYLLKGIRRQLIQCMEREKKTVSIDNMLHAMIEIELTEAEETTDQQALAIKRAVQNLSKRQKEVIFLRYYENLSCEEIAEVMDLNINTVYNNISLAIKKLKAQFENNPLIILLLSTIQLNCI